ncbi:MAG: hypothetical protein RKO66_10820 [Candidatus Contendobacter sp.]|nr:hypothetical protein [Candidatus Contendobacter sp.]MDS4058746.1 hypothetical protein [Candidatus Contendobacter sp.]
MRQKLKLASIHLSENNIMILNVFLDLTRSSEVAVWEYTDSPETASALLFDTDSEEGNRELRRWISRNSHQVLIAFSGKPEDVPPGLLVVPRPLRLAGLMQALQEAQKQILNHSRRADSASSTATQRVFEVLYKNKNLFLKITDQAYRLIIFNTEQRSYYTTSLIRVDVERLLISPVTSVQVQEISAARFVKETQSMKAQDLEPPLWLTALAISNGKLFDGLARNGFYRLSRWPNFKKLGQDTLHLKLTVLLRRGGTIDSFARATGETQENIIDFINACRALHYLEMQANPLGTTQQAVEQNRLNSEKRSLLSRIRTRLGI